jgi:hypothetical protein
MKRKYKENSLSHRLLLFLERKGIIYDYVRIKLDFNQKEVEL